MVNKNLKCGKFIFYKALSTKFDANVIRIWLLKGSLLMIKKFCKSLIIEMTGEQNSYYMFFFFVYYIQRLECEIFCTCDIILYDVE